MRATAATASGIGFLNIIFRSGATMMLPRAITTAAIHRSCVSWKAGEHLAMRRYVEIWGIMLRNSLIRELSFKANFILWMVVEVLWFCGQIVFFGIIFGQIGRASCRER